MCVSSFEEVASIWALVRLPRTPRVAIRRGFDAALNDTFRGRPGPRRGDGLPSPRAPWTASRADRFWRSDSSERKEVMRDWISWSRGLLAMVRLLSQLQV